MTPIQRYLAEEIAVDHVEGLMPRREALRRLVLLGLTPVAASALLAACGADETTGSGADSDGSQATTNQPPAGTTPPGPEPLTTEAITFAGPDGRTLQGAWASAAQPRGAVLVIHENRGLNDHIRSVAGRLGASGYSALALDLLSEEGGSDSFDDPAEATAALNDVPEERFAADMKAAVDELERRASGVRIGATGFCFGGGMIWLLLASGEPRLFAAAPFYGPLPEGADFAGSPNAAVLGIYGELDNRVNATRDPAQSALREAGLVHQIVTFPGANHAFFNDTGQRYDADAATQAYQQLIDWFGLYLS